MNTTEATQPFSKRNIIFYAFCIIIFILAIHYAARIKNVEQTLLEIQPFWLGIALVTQVLTYAFNALIFYTLLDREASPISLNNLFKIAIVSLFITQIIPSGGLSGTSFVFDEMVGHGASARKAFSAIIIQALSSYVALLALLYGAGALYRITYHKLPHLFVYIGIIGTIFYLILCIVMFLISKKRILDFLHRKLSRFKFVRTYLEHIDFASVGETEKSPLAIFLENKRAAWMVLVFQVGIFLADALTVFALMHGLSIHLNFIAILFGLMLTLGIAGIPTLPGALIVYEGSMTLFYSTMGVPVNAALIITLLFRVLSFWMPIPIGLVLYRNLMRTKK